MKKILYFAIIASIFISCAKENIIPPPPQDNISGRTIRYTITVLRAENISAKSQTGIFNAKVKLVMNDSIYSKTTDSSGIVTFNNLAAGYVSVSIEYPEYTSLTYIADLTPDSSVYDASNLRNATSVVALFPTSGEGTATVKGKLLAQIDASTPEYELVTLGLNVFAFVADDCNGYLNHSGAGKIISFVYGNTYKQTTSDNQGDYILEVPASGTGLGICLYTDDFRYNNIAYHSPVDTIIVYSRRTQIHDIVID